MGKQKTLTVKQPKLVDPVIGDDDKSISTASKGTNDLFANLEAQVGSKFVCFIHFRLLDFESLVGFVCS